jgi:hypothetical protein
MDGKIRIWRNGNKTCTHREKLSAKYRRERRMKSGTLNKNLKYQSIS